MARARSTGHSLGILFVTALCLGLLSTDASVAGADDIRVIFLATNDIVFDQVRTRIYASVPRTGGAFAGSVVAIDPVTGAVLGPVVTLPPGSEPGKLALSGDSQFLYVALDGLAVPPAVRRVDLSGAISDLQFPLGSDPARGPWSVEDMAVVPGNPRAIAIALKFADALSPRHAGVAAYDDGVRRPVMATGPVASNVIEFSSNPARLYGLDTESGESRLSRMVVSGLGVSIQDVSPNPFGAFGTVTDVVFDADRLYATNGQVIFAESLAPGGTYGGVPASALVLPDSTVARTYFLGSSTLSGFALAAFGPIGSLSIPGVAGAPGSLIRWGPGQVAFRTSGDQASVGQVYLITADFTGLVGPGPIFPGPPVSSPRRAFVEGFFQNVLGRSPEADGLAAWDNFLATHCDASGVQAMSHGFFDSEEFRSSRPLALQGLVEVLYQTFLGRASEPAGMATWAGVLREVRLQVATEGFIGSAEFRALLPDPTDRTAVTEVVRQLYAEVLGREADPAGLAAWVDFVAATRDVKSAARGFLASAEFEARALTARAYVAILYGTFLGREATVDEVDAWERVFRTTLLRVIDLGFVPSAEFRARLGSMCR